LCGFLWLVIGVTVGASIIHNIPPYVANYLPNANFVKKSISNDVYKTRD